MAREQEMRVYISSTLLDLQDERSQVIDIVRALGLHPVVFEDFARNTKKSNFIELARTEIAQAGIFLGIYGSYYGQIPTAQDSEEFANNYRSYTHLEFQWALDYNIPMLLFLQANEDEQGNPIEHKLAEIEKHRQELFGTLLTDLKDSQQPLFGFTSVENLLRQVGAELIRAVLGTKRDIVFISHASKDDRFVNQLDRNLDAVGLQPWIDHKHILPGADWDVAIKSALDASSTLVLVLTPDANKSIVTKAEWSYFGENGKLLIPLLLKDTDMPFRLRVFTVC